MTDHRDTQALARINQAHAIALGGHLATNIETAAAAFHVTQMDTMVSLQWFGLVILKALQNDIRECARLHQGGRLTRQDQRDLALIQTELEACLGACERAAARE